MSLGVERRGAEYQSYIVRLGRDKNDLGEDKRFTKERRVELDRDVISRELGGRTECIGCARGLGWLLHSTDEEPETREATRRAKVCTASSRSSSRRVSSWIPPHHHFAPSSVFYV